MSPEIKWQDIDKILHRTKGTLTKVVGIYRLSERFIEVKHTCPQKCDESIGIGKELNEIGEKIVEICKTVKDEAMDEIEAINEVILNQMENDE